MKNTIPPSGCRGGSKDIKDSRIRENGRKGTEGSGPLIETIGDFPGSTFQVGEESNEGFLGESLDYNLLLLN